MSERYRKFYVSYAYTNATGHGFGGTSAILEGPLTRQWMDDVRRSIAETCGASVVILNLIPLEEGVE